MTYREILLDLDEITDNFSIEHGAYKVSDKSDVQNAINILSNYYTDVDGKNLDYRNKEADGTDYVIIFSNPVLKERLMKESVDSKFVSSSDIKAAKYIIKHSKNPKEVELAQETIRKYKEQQKNIEEAIEKHDTLNPKLWDENNELKPEVRDKIEEIVQKFDNNLKENDVELDVKDITIIGSNANYNYSPDSDVDIHIIADTSVYPDQEDLAMKVYLAYKSLFNNKYDPTLNGIEAEIYVEPDEVHANSNGVYSLKDGWLKEPEQVDVPEIDPDRVQELIQPFEDRYNALINSEPSISDVDALIDDIYLQRQKSIMKNGEFGDGNICFKEFRNRGYLQNLRDLKVELENKEMSLNDMNEQLLDIYGLNEGCDDHIDEGLTSSDLFVGAEFVNPEDRVKIVITDISDDLVTYEESQGDSDAFTVTDPVSYFISMLNEYDYVLDENCNKDLKEDVFENENGMEISFPDPRDTLAVFLEWEGIIGYTDEIYDVAQEGYDALDEYLEYEGILGYTDKIYNIINNNSVWCSQMEMEDFISVCKALYIDYTLAIDDDIDESLKEGTSFDSTPGFMSPEEIRAKELADKERANAEKEQIKAQKAAERKEKAKAERAEQRRIDQREKVNSLSYDSLADMAGLDEDNNDLTKDELLAVLRSNMSDADILKLHKKMFEDLCEDAPSYAVKYITGYAGSGVNHTETKFFRTKEEQEKFVNELKDRNATGIETYTVNNFYHDKQERDKKNLYLDTLSEDFVISDTPGTEYVNTNGIIIRMTEPTTEGELQFDIVENGNVIDHRKVSDLKSLARIIDANGYKRVDEDCNKDLDEAVDESDAAGKALADYLGISLDDIDYVGGDVYDTSEGEYLVASEEEAYKHAVEAIKNDVDDLGLDAFTPSFKEWILNNAIDEDAINDVIDREIDYYETTEDDPDMLEFLKGLDSFDDKVSYVNDLYADDFSVWAVDFIDLDRVAEEAISEDGVAHFIAFYDGDEIDLAGDLKAYRLN